MTDVIDFLLLSKHQNSSSSQVSYNSLYSKRQVKIKATNKIIEGFLCKIDKNYIKTIHSYTFKLNNTKSNHQNHFYNHRINLVGQIKFKNQIFSLRIYFVDPKGQKIIVKSSYHRALISNFVLQINAQLQNFKIQYNPVSGQSSFLFNVKSQSNDIGLLKEILQYSFNSYFEQSSAHFYLLNLLQITDKNQNFFIKGIDQKMYFVKKWIGQRQEKNNKFLKEFNFYYKYLQQIHYQQKIYCDILKNGSRKLPIKQQIERIINFLYPEKQLNHSDDRTGHNKMHRIKKKFQKYYLQQQFFSLHLINKSTHQNFININARQSKKLQAFLEEKCILRSAQYQFSTSLMMSKRHFNSNLNQKYQQSFPSNYQSQNQQIQSDQHKIHISDKATGKNYFVKCLFLTKQNAKKQHLICQKLCKFQQFKFFNQYFDLANYNMLKDGYVLVNAYPKRVCLKDFLVNNGRTLSINARLKICINLVQITLTLQKKSKIANYFPYISAYNLEISHTLYLSFKILTNVSIHPLLQLCNTLFYIFFGRSITLIKRNKKPPQLIKGDQIQNKNWGPSLCITFFKYYLLELYQDALKILSLRDLKNNQKMPENYINESQLWIKQRINNACQQLLVVLCEYESIFHGNNDEQYLMNSCHQQQEA